MAINLQGYDTVETALAVRLEITNYRTGPGATPVSKVLYFTDYYRTITINQQEYEPLGPLMYVSSTRNEIANTSAGMTITISGIPNQNIREIIYSDIKGSEIELWRVLFDPVTGNLLPISGNPAGRFFGVVNTYNLTDEARIAPLTDTVTLNLECASYIDVLRKLITGRRTNPVDLRQTTLNSDVSFDRVPNLKNSNFQFGAPKT